MRIYFGLLFATLLVYAQSARFSFVNFDDPAYVSGNAHVREGLSPAGVAWAFTSTEDANWFPVTRLSHLLDTSLFGDGAGGPHVVNVLLHAGAAMLLFAFLLRATGARWPSAFVAFVFALHPLHVESVAWVSERKDVLSAFFWFLALWAWVSGRKRLALAAFCLGLMSKPMIVTLPLLLLLLDRWPLRRGGWFLREKIPFFVLAAAGAIATVFVQAAGGAVRSEEAFPLGSRVANALVSYVVYIGQMFRPVKLAVFYPWPAAIPVWEPLLAGLALAGVSAAAWFYRHRYPWLGVGWLWYLLTLAPVIGFVQVGAQAHADRYMYVPMVGLTIAIAWGAVEWVRSKQALAIVAAAACVALAVLSARQAEYWQNSETLFSHAAEVTEGNYLAEHNLGDALLETPGRLPDAIRHLEASLRIRPDSIAAHTDLGNALVKTPGRMAEGIAQYREAIRLDPSSPIPRENLAHALAGEEEEEADLHYQAGMSLAKASDRTGDAIREFEAALRIRPDFAEAHNNLGVALSRDPRRASEAVAEFEAAIRIRPDYAGAHFNLGVALANLPGRVKDAIREFETAERLQPDAETRAIIERLRGAGR